MRKRKTISGIVLALLITVPFIVTCVYVFNTQILKKFFYSRLKQQRTETIIIPKDKVKWEKKDKEIIINNKLFDIKKIIRNDSILECVGWFDIPETEWKDRFKELTYSTNSKEHEQKKYLTFYYPFFEQYISYYFFRAFLNCKKENFYTEKVKNILHKIITPPPQLFI